MSQSFTTYGVGGLLNVLKNQCGISPLPSPASPNPAIIQFDAIWDTGATNSLITQTVVDACGLIPTGMAQVHGVHGLVTVETYVVNIHLPNYVAVQAVPVSKGTLPDAQVLIGMDIINQGDFAVTNKGGITKFSFRTPSKVHIDFVEEHHNHEIKATTTRGTKARPKRSKSFGRNKRKK